MVARPTRSLQENCLSMLLHNDEHGRTVAALVDAGLFEGDYGVLAERAIDYWQRYNVAPKAQAGDLVSEIIEEGGPRARTFEEILRSTVVLADQVNTAFTLDQLRSFVRAQQIKRALMESAEKVQAMQEQSSDEVEAIWQDLLTNDDKVGFERGMSLGEYDRVLKYIEGRQLEFPTGIEQLDKAHIGPARETVLLLLGPTGAGKTWGCIHIVRQSLLQGKRVAHVSLEMSEEQVGMRYYQHLFGAAKRRFDPYRDERHQRIMLTEFKEDKGGRLVLDEDHLPVQREIDPEFALTGIYSRDELELRLATSGARLLDNLIIKRFASLTIDGLEAWLDQLARHENFEPDMLILDYFGLISHGQRMSEHRLGLGDAFKRFRSLMISRHMAGVAPHQVSRLGSSGRTARMHHVAEDWSMTNTADVVLSFSRTEDERAKNLARLFVDKARDEIDKFGMVLIQNYALGQFALKSYYLPGHYFKVMEPWFDRDKKDDEREDRRERRYDDEEEPQERLYDRDRR